MMKLGNTQNTNAKLNVIYYIAFAALSLSRGIEKIALVVPLDLLEKALQIVALGLIAPLLIDRWKRSSRRVRCFLLILLLLEVLSFLTSRYTYLLWITLFIVAGSNRDIKQLAKIALSISCLVVIFSYTFYIFGLTDAETVYRGNNVRLAFGFSHPNCFGEYLLRIQIAILVIRFGKLGRLDCVITLLLSIFAGVLADSKTTVLGLLFSLLVLFIMQAKARQTDSTKRLAKAEACLLATLTFLCIGGMLIYAKDNPVLRCIDVLVSGRLEYPHTLVEATGLTLFGFDISTSSNYVSEWSLVNGVVPVDNAYMSLLINQGIVLFATVFLLLLFAIYNLWRIPREGKYIALGAGLSAMFIALSESYVLDFSFSYYLIFVGIVLLDNTDDVDLLRDQDTND